MTIESLIGSTINEYRIQKLIGSGAYGLVFLAENIYTHELVAIKSVGKRVQNQKTAKHSEQLTCDLETYFELRNYHLEDLRPLNLAKIRDMESLPCPFLKEVSLHLQVHDHPNILSIHTILDSPVAIFIIMDYFPESDLFVNIVDSQVYVSSSTLIKTVFIQLLDAVAYCHAHGIAHCDIKPENIMCADKGSRVVLGDFGLAVQTQYIQAKTCIGSSYYMPPERLTQLNHNLHSTQYPAAKGDIWSLAIILINLCCTRNPWTKACDQDATYRAFKDDPHVLTDILNISDELFSILRSCLVEEPSKRITLFELRERVLKCRSFTRTGPLSQCDDMDRELQCGLECVAPDSGSISSGGDSIGLPFMHEIDHYPTNELIGIKKYEPTISMMTNFSFNMNVA
ncbi:Serine/threonine-protein kinase VHS1 [Cyberlindnera fabianii]|uniref:Serine/threonine-protein kinase VHS1 n=1 Tax=Cyberlindnera fabianii TaxID=36022 RepID=A0A1V2L9L9_CYBFA|nr:Serine/threonine-protein kinase VHS1 [Cyberlindnera fabianii]